MTLTESPFGNEYASGGAVFVLGEAGIVKRMTVVVPWWLNSLFAEHFPGVRIDRTNLSSDDNGINTSAGPGVDHRLMARLVRQYLGPLASDWIVHNAGIGDMALNTMQPDNIVLDTDNAMLNEVLTWLDHHHHLPTTVADVAKQFGTTPHSLTRYFRTALGVSPLEHIQTLRINTAKRLLQQHEIKASRVAALVGYQDARFFRQIFERETGVSLESYRAVVCSL